MSTPPITADMLKPGTRVRITKQVSRLGKVPTTAVEGVIVGYDQRKTGSWFAHSKDDKLWLDRLEVRKDDGEIYVCNVEAHTHIAVLDGPDAGAAGMPTTAGGTGVPPVDERSQMHDGPEGHPTQPAGV